MAVVADYFQTGAVLLDHEVARIVAQQIVLLRDKGPSLQRGNLATAKTAKRMDLLGDVDHVAKIVGEIAPEPRDILRPPRVVDVADDASVLVIWCPP